MKAKINIVLALLLSINTLNVIAATGEDIVNTESAAVSDSQIETDAAEINLEEWTVDTEVANVEGDLNAATDKTIVVMPKWNVSNYPEVACDKDFFTANSCNQCFDWGKRVVGEKITGLTDSWTNPNTTEQIIYKDEQIAPELINLWWANTIWLTNPEDPMAFWKQSDEVVWTDSATWSGKQEFLLEWGKTVNLLESDLAASYALQSTDKAEWDAIGLLKFTINYHDTDETAKESEQKTHVECVAYYSSAPVATTPTTPETPQEATQVKTWPASYILIALALILSLGLVKYRKKA